MLLGNQQQSGQFFAFPIYGHGSKTDLPWLQKSALPYQITIWRERLTCTNIMWCIDEVRKEEKKRAQLFLVLFDSQSIRITTARASRSGAQGPDRDWCSEEVNNLRNMDLPCSSKGIAITLQFLEPEGSFSMQQVRSSARVMRVSSERIRHVQLYLFAF